MDRVPVFFCETGPGARRVATPASGIIMSLLSSSLREGGGLVGIVEEGEEEEEE